MLTYDDQGQANIQVHAELNGNVIGDCDGVGPDSKNVSIIYVENQNLVYTS